MTLIQSSIIFPSANCMHPNYNSIPSGIAALIKFSAQYISSESGVEIVLNDQKAMML